MAQTYLLESPPPKNSRTKPSPFVFGDFGAVPELFSGTVQRESCLEKKQCNILVMLCARGPQKFPPAQKVLVPIFSGGRLRGPPAQIPSVLTGASQVSPDSFVLAGSN